MRFPDTKADRLAFPALATVFAVLLSRRSSIGDAHLDPSMRVLFQMVHSRGRAEPVAIPNDEVTPLGRSGASAWGSRAGPPNVTSQGRLRRRLEELTRDRPWRA